MSYIYHLYKCPDHFKQKIDLDAFAKQIKALSGIKAGSSAAEAPPGALHSSDEDDDDNTAVKGAAAAVACIVRSVPRQKKKPTAAAVAKAKGKEGACPPKGKGQGRIKVPHASPALTPSGTAPLLEGRA